MNRRTPTLRTVAPRETLGIMVMAAMVLWTGVASALYGSRKGIAFELGLGPGMCASSDWVYAYEGGVRVSTDRVGTTGFSINTRLRLGWGLSEKWMVFLMDDIAWANDQLTGPGESTTARNEILGLALTRFLKSESPSLFFEAAAGSARVRQGEAHRFDESGTGIQLTFGSETIQGMALRLSWARAFYDDLEDRSSVAATISWLGY